MKKLLLLLLAILPLIGSAQKFYEPSELRIDYLVWESEADVDYLVQNGTKTVLSTLPVTTAPYVSYQTPEICSTYLHNGKFISLIFSIDQGIKLCGASQCYKLSDYAEILGVLNYLPYYNGIIFDKIVYDPWYNRILIPTGTDMATGQSYAISLYLDDSGSGISAPKMNSGFDEENVSYYNLQGQKVDLDSSKGQILIKTDGKTTSKFINR